MMLEAVKIVRMDLYGKRPFCNRIPHFLVVDKDGNRIFVRIANKNEQPSEEQERELKHFQADNVVDVEVDPVDWTIGKLSGTSYFYRAISSNGRRIHA